MAELQTPKINFQNKVDQLHASGDDETHLLVLRGPLSMDSDASWREVRAYIGRKGWVLTYDEPVTDGFTARAYCPPGVRLSEQHQRELEVFAAIMGSATARQ